MKNNNYKTMVNVYPYNKWIALTLCVTLGIFGAHKYYEQKLVVGALYSLTLGFLGIGVLFDIIRYLSMKSPYYNTR